MSPCTRFEREGLLALERGEELDPHFEGCADCIREREAYRALTARLASLGAEDRPPAGYEARILERIAHDQSPEPSTPSNGPWNTWRLALALAAAAVLAIWLVRGSPEPASRSDVRPSLAIMVHAEQDDGPMRSIDSAKPGDRLFVRAATGELPNVELRIWQGADVLLVRCSEQPPCQRGSGTIEVEVALPTRGDYEVILAVSERALPGPRPRLDDDIAAIEAAGGRLERAEPIRVR
jgi:hypothetical protein